MIKADEMARDFANNPTTETLLRFLCMPKVLLTGSWKGAMARIRAYPNVPWPTLNRHARREGGRSRKDKSVKDRVHSLLQRAHLKKASSELGGVSAIAPDTAETREALVQLFPPGLRYPFPPAPRNEAGVKISADISIEKLCNYPLETSPGPAGWTPALLRTATKRPAIQSFFMKLASLIGSGLLPGAHLFRVGKLTPLVKTGGGIRPICTTDLTYRLACRALLESAGDLRQTALLPTQSGVGIKGGVEPVILTVRALTQMAEADRPYRHLTTVDLANAFGSISRTSIFSGLFKYSKQMIPAARLRLGKPSTLIIGETPSARFRSIWRSTWKARFSSFLIWTT